MAKEDFRWHRWYYENWGKDSFVRESDYETLGIYFLLLQRQMEEGWIPNDLTRISKYIRGISIERLQVLWEKEQWEKTSPNDRNRLQDMFQPMTHRWEPGEKKNGFALNPKDGQWIPLETPHSDRLQNPFLVQVIALSEKERKGKSQGGRQSGSIRFQKSLEGAIEQVASMSEGPGFDFAPILKDYPLKLKSIGKIDGIRIINNTITTDEDYARLHAAVKNYRKEWVGKDSQYIKRLDKFMCLWTDYVPEGFQVPTGFKAPRLDNSTLLAPAPGTPEPPAPTKHRRHFLDREYLPWFVSRYASDKEKSEMATRWPEEKKKRWLDGEHFPEVNDPDPEPDPVSASGTPEPPPATPVETN